MTGFGNLRKMAAGGVLVSESLLFRFQLFFYAYVLLFLLRSNADGRISSCLVSFLLVITAFGNFYV